MKPSKSTSRRPSTTLLLAALAVATTLFACGETLPTIANVNPNACCTSAAECVAAGLDVLTACGVGQQCIEQICQDLPKPECIIASDCSDPSRPFCVDQTCHSCDATDGCTADAPVCSIVNNSCGGCAVNADCAAYSATPACGPAGACVQCAASSDCSGTSPVCDANTCRACSSDDDCASGACDFDTGACIASDNIIYVAPGGVNGSCTTPEPCRTFQNAVSSISPTRFTIVLAAGTYADSFNFNGPPNPSLAIATSVHGAHATITGNGEYAPFISATNSNLRVYGVNFVGAASISAVACSNSTCLLQDITASNFLDVVDGQASTMQVLHSTFDIGAGDTSHLELVDGPLTTISQSSFHGVAVELVRTNSVMTNNEIFGTAGVALVISDTDQTVPHTHEVEFNTLYDNGTGLTSISTQPPINCTDVVPQVVLRNNIIIDKTRILGTQGPVISDAPDGCASEYSIIVQPGQTGPAIGVGNIFADPKFVDAAHSDFHLAAGSPAIDVASHDATLVVDFDGDPRPQGVFRDIGADEFRQ